LGIELDGRLSEILIATGNAGKVREFRDMLGKFKWRSLGEFPGIGEIEETGQTFRANAMLKAAGYAKVVGIWAMADDSGLEVDALCGKPGVHSARWAELNGKGRGDAANNALLLEQMKDIPEDRRTGRFVCVLALADPTGKIVLTVRETIEGRIGRGPVGSGGFGYDPLFHVDALGRTTAELPAAQKHEISHRGKALRRVKGLLEKTGLKIVLDN
jgi:XTP/dITP diphosphohydrolase